MSEEVKGVVGGAGQGAATGAVIGSVVPGFGTAVGAIIGGIAGGLFGFLGGKATGDANDAAYAAAYANAADLRALAALNSQGYLAAGGVNAGAIRTVGEANALMVERATARNMFAYALQADEDRRRHLIQEYKLAGNIRAPVGAKGIQTNTGTPLRYLNQQVELGIKERQYGDLKALITLENMQAEGADKASVIRLTADQQAMVTEFNASLQAELSFAEAQRQATAMERGAEVNSQIAAAQGTTAMFNQLTSAANTFGNYAVSTNMFGTATTGAYAFSGQGWNTSSYGNNNAYSINSQFNSAMPNPYGSWGS